MCLCLIICARSLIRRRYDASSSATVMKKKGWKCCDPTTGRCYVSRNVIFDEASSWWSTQEAILPDSTELENKLLEKLEHDHIDEESAGGNSREQQAPPLAEGAAFLRFAASGGT